MQAWTDRIEARVNSDDVAYTTSATLPGLPSTYDSRQARRCRPNAVRQALERFPASG